MDRQVGLKKMNKFHCIRTSAFAAMLLWTSLAQGMAPPYISDKELAGYPIIVVAKWEKAPFSSHHKYIDEKQRRGIARIEAYTKLHVVRVIKGDVKPGVQPLMVGCGIGWKKDGTWLNSASTTQLFGDVRDITKPCIWFLERERSWDEKDKRRYLSISNYCAIQPLTLEKFFVAMGSPDPETQVPQLLTPDKPKVALRILRYISGGIWPWPYDPSHFGKIYSNPAKRGKLLAAQADRVWTIVDSDAQDLRPYAVSVYAELKGKDCIEAMRGLLNDKNPVVRGVAIGVLARHRDATSLGSMQQAIKGVDDGWLACKLVEVLSSWGDDRVVPALITFLQNDKFVYQYGDDLGIPALKARQALKKITGQWFPFDVRKSMDAWDKAKGIPDEAKRSALLAKVLPDGDCPVRAELVGQPRHEQVPADEAGADTSKRSDSDQKVFATVRIRNVTGKPVMIAKVPSDVKMSWPGGVSSYGHHPFNYKPRKGDFVFVHPLQSLEYEVKLNESFLIAEPSTRKLKLAYLSNGNSVGLNAWIGTVDVQFGPEWKGKREVKHVEEKWPNGNLKATGTTVNGHKFGEWHYFNEQGDRIKIAYYGQGRGTATCNPDHPSNKGAGKRPKEKN